MWDSLHGVREHLAEAQALCHTVLCAILEGCTKCRVAGVTGALDQTRKLERWDIVRLGEAGRRYQFDRVPRLHIFPVKVPLLAQLLTCSTGTYSQKIRGSAALV